MDMKNRIMAAGAFLLSVILLMTAGCDSKIEAGTDIDGIYLDQDEIVMDPGETVTIHADVATDYGKAEDIILEWKSSEPSVASVEEGTVKALAPGRTFVTAGYANRYATAIVEVRAASGFRILDKQITLQSGMSQEIHYMIEPSEASGIILWTSSAPETVSVDDGIVTAHQEGQAVITATADKLTEEIPVYVSGNADIGDYMYSDGTFSAEIFGKKQAVGIVFWLGDATASDKLLKRDFPGCCHGLAAALTEENSSWQKEYYLYTSTVDSWAKENFPEGDSPITGIDMDSPLNRTVGYNNTKVIEAFNSDPDNLGWKVDAVKRLLFYKGDSRYAAPENTSGWYLPSAKELSLMCAGDFDGNIWEYYDENLPVRDILNKQLNMLGGAQMLSPELYWSSSEYDATNAFCVGFYNGKTPYNIKGAMNMKVRYILAF